MVVEVKLPKLGRIMEEGKIVNWYKGEGDEVEEGEPLFEVETDKASSDVEAKTSGTLLKVIASPGEIIPVNKIVAFIGEPGEEIPEITEKEEIKESEAEEKIQEKEPSKEEVPKPSEKEKAEKVKAIPAARRLAKEKGISLSKVRGTGPQGAITEEDVEKAITEEETPEEIKVKEKVALEGMKKRTAKRMTESFQEAPHFYLSKEVDMEKAAEFRKEITSKIKKESGVKPTFTDIIVAAVAKTLKNNPYINATLDEEEIVLYEDVNVGIAVATDQGLVVPVIHDANEKALSEISSQRSELVDKARSNNLQVDEISAGTFTITNLGMFGISQFDAIINPPESSILAIGEIKEKPVAVDEKVEVRKRMNLTLSIDHRIVDGAIGANFLEDLKKVLENPYEELKELEEERTPLEETEYDLDMAVIGGGIGGYTSAIRGAQLGGKVALVEKGELGGTCLNWGCIPTKSLIHGTELYSQIEEAEEFGITTQNVEIDTGKMFQKKERAVKRLKKGVENLLRSNNITLKEGHAKIIDPHTVEVDYGEKDKERLSCRNIIIATGSKPLNISGIEPDGENILTNREALNLKNIPESMLIIGGGPMGLEFASVFNRLGAKVILTEMKSTLLPNMDRDLSKQIEKHLKEQGIEIHTNAKVTGVEKGEKNIVKVSKENSEEEIEAEKVIMLAGREPYTENLGLESLDIKTERNGCIKVNEKLETNLSSIYAIGDVVGAPMLAHVATKEGIIAAENSMGKKSTINYENVPTCVYTSPEIASVGISEREAEDENINIKKGTFPFRANGKAIAMGKKEGFIKILSNDSGEILGMHMIGPRVTELIAEGSLAMGVNAKVKDLDKAIYPHPTLSEAMLEAALDVEDEAVQIP